MMIVITESASDDIAEGFLFYEMQEQGLGEYFESSIQADIRSLLIFAGVHEVHFNEFYRKIASRFPYAIYYSVEDATIMIHAVLDTRRDPEKLADRFS
ncbi:MAG: type II toxin-antitoxin system RelE/ParE family toxin [Acidobacteria bacterium]|nr:type II toxin-antitoxin system RelE/ParE family toxin [Acidobacteriota bacterium]